MEAGNVVHEAGKPVYVSVFTSQVIPLANHLPSSEIGGQQHLKEPDGLLYSH